MNLILLHEQDRHEPAGTAGDEFVLRDARAAHVHGVLGAAVGDRVRVGLLEGPVGEAEVLEVGESLVRLRTNLTGDPPARPPVELVLAIPRPKMLRRLLPQIAALGVDRIVLLRTWRVAKPYLTAAVLRPEVYRPLLWEGLMQARCTREPRLEIEPLFRPFAEDRAGDMARGSDAVVAHPGSGVPLSQVPLVAARRVVAVGPEGGFLPFEVDLLAAAGFQPVDLGPRVWRVDTACVALLALGALRREAPDASGPPPSTAAPEPSGVPHRDCTPSHPSSGTLGS